MTLMTKYLLIFSLFSFITMGCATPLNDTHFQYADQKPMCKKDILGLPPDFPDNLFFKWITQNPADITTIGPFPVVIWGQVDGDTIYMDAVLVFKITDKKQRAIAMLEARRGKPVIIWLSKEATDLDKILLDMLVNAFNPERET